MLQQSQQRRRHGYNSVGSCSASTHTAVVAVGPGMLVTLVLLIINSLCEQQHPAVCSWSCAMAEAVPCHATPRIVALCCADAVLDACLAQDPTSKVACETAVKDNFMLVSVHPSAHLAVSTDCLSYFSAGDVLAEHATESTLTRLQQAKHDKAAAAAAQQHMLHARLCFVQNAI